MLAPFLAVRIVIGLACSCASSSSSSRPPDASVDANEQAPVDGSAGVDAGSPEDAGTYHQSVYTCCGEGRGLSCCTADAGLLGYDLEPDGAIVAVGGRSGGTGANCFRFGGTSGACTARGDQLDHKDICSVCCAGLVEADWSSPDDAGACVSNFEGVALCLACGNGTCDPDENRCNCPADCH